MFSETRYALNGDLRVAHRTSRGGPRDIVFVPNWFTNCEVFPELPSIQGSAGRLSRRRRTLATRARQCPARTPSRPGSTGARGGIVLQASHWSRIQSGHGVPFRRRTGSFWPSERRWIHVDPAV